MPVWVFIEDTKIGAFGASSTPSFNFTSSPAFGKSTSAFGSSPFGTSTSPFGAQSSGFEGGFLYDLSGHRAGGAAIVYEHGADIEALMPKLRRSDYYTEPQIQELAAKERAEPGFCRHVKKKPTISRFVNDRIVCDKFLLLTDLQRKTNIGDIQKAPRLCQRVIDGEKMLELEEVQLLLTGGDDFFVEAFCQDGRIYFTISLS
ncbi:hypothetical protein L484_020797 [Morus notabilis]|uniref:Uncharacterized protein n=1 Tax=Morus notabilis TaxID=981085 RepID=W9RV96_9ROSA|nr:hypothetical protein L484_020797 [Morus notabilis]